MVNGLIHRYSDTPSCVGLDNSSVSEAQHVVTQFELMTICFDTMTNYYLFHKPKFIRNCEFNH